MFINLHIIFWLRWRIQQQITLSGEKEDIIWANGNLELMTIFEHDHSASENLNRNDS